MFAKLVFIITKIVGNPKYLDKPAKFAHTYGNIKIGDKFIMLSEDSNYFMILTLPSKDIRWIKRSEFDYKIYEDD